MIREEASKILGMRIPPHGWHKALNEMWSTGRPGPKQMKELMFLLLAKMEELEEKDGKPDTTEKTIV